MNITTKFIKARTLPYGLKEKVEKELDGLIELGVLKQVDYSGLASPIVPVLKKDGSVLICGDFKITINPHLEVDQFPLPLIDDILAELGGFIACVNQLELDKNSQELVTISTHKILFHYLRLPFGVAPACAKFQKLKTVLFSGIPGVKVSVDDLLISGQNQAKHDDRLFQVLSIMKISGLKVFIEKCSFNEKKVQYLGFTIRKDGIHASDEKIRAIKEAPIPKSVTELKSILGIINYYGKFVPNLATILSPLHDLLKKNSKFIWNRKCDNAFSIIVKSILMSNHIMMSDYQLN